MDTTTSTITTITLAEVTPGQTIAHTFRYGRLADEWATVTAAPELHPLLNRYGRPIVWRVPVTFADGTAGALVARDDTRFCLKVVAA